MLPLIIRWMLWYTTLSIKKNVSKNFAAREKRMSIVGFEKKVRGRYKSTKYERETKY